jgi:hypothetical protein
MSHFLFFTGASPEGDFIAKIRRQSNSKEADNLMDAQIARS